MTKQEEIIHALDLGKHVIVINDDGFYSDFWKDFESGFYFNKSWENTLEEAKKTLNVSYWTKKQILDTDFQISKIYDPIPKAFKVGDKVRILDTIKKTDDWEYYKDELLDKKGTVEEVRNNCSGLYYLVNSWLIGHKYLAPDFEEEDNLLGEEVEVKLKGNTYTAKIIKKE